MVVEVVSVIVTIILTLIGIAAFNRVIAVHDFLGAVLVVALILLGVNLTNKFPDTVRVHINALNAKNPLYTKGYFRKNASEKGVFSNITILLIIQILAILTIAFTLLYFGVSVIGISNRNPVLEKILFFSIGLLTGLKFMVTVYFELRYDRYFVYFEDKNVGWQPFKYMFTRFDSSGKSIALRRTYSETFREAEGKLNMNLYMHDYKLFVKYIYGDEEYLFFTREKNDNYDVFLIISVEKFKKDSMERFDKVFALFWENYGKEKTMNDKIRLYTLIYAKSDFEEKLIKRLRWHETGSQEYCSIARKMITNGTIPQKRNRYRLFAKVNLNNSKLEVYRYYKGILRCKDYEEMQKEMLDIIDIHNQNNLNDILN